MDVVLLCRVSTAGQDYSRQVDELSDFCSKMGVERQKDIHRQGLGREENRGEKRAHRDAGLHPREQYRQGLRAGDKQARQEHARGAEGDPAAERQRGPPVHQELQPGDARRRRETQPDSEHDMHLTSGGGADGTPYYHGADGVGP